MQKKIILATVLLSISGLAFGQELPKQKLEGHSHIKGTNIFMIPPSAFKTSANFKGFQNPSDPTSMIMALEIPGPYLEVIKGFNSEDVESRGMVINVKTDIKVAGLDGLLIELEHLVNEITFSKNILVYGDDKSTTMINGVYVKDSIELGKKIKESLLTTFVDSDLKANARESLDYQLDERAGSLKFLAVMGNGMLLNRDLKTPTESIDKASLLTDKSFAKTEIADKKLFCISRIKKYSEDYSIMPSKGINEIEIDGLKGFELFAKNNSRLDEEILQVILFNKDGGYYLFFGTYKTGEEKAVIDIKNVIKTFKRKT